MGPDVRRGGRVCRVPIKFKEYEVEGLVNPSKEPSTISQEVQAAVAQVMSHEHDSCIAFESLFTLAQEEQTDQHPLLRNEIYYGPRHTVSVGGQEGKGLSQVLRSYAERNR